MTLIDQPVDLNKVFSNDFIPNPPLTTPPATVMATLAATAESQ
jgi:hypothetical protein